MPLIAVDYQTKRVEQRGLLLESCVNGIENLAFFSLTVGVELVELVSDLAGASCISSTEEFDYIAGDIHATSCVDPWCNAESNLSGSKGPPAHLRDLEQSFETRVYRGTQSLQAKLGEHAV